jgi:segregation and condensation protein B
MNQSSWDDTLQGVRPSPGPGKGAVSPQSSRDKRTKRSLPGTTVRREGRAISEQDRTPISWDALAAELAATRDEAEERGDGDPETWDAVARALADRVAERPAPADEAPPVVVPEEPEPQETPAAEESEDGEPLELVDDATLRARLEALLFVVDDPVDVPTLAAALRCPPERAAGALADLAADYDARGAGIALREVGPGWRLYTREDHAEVVERWVADASRSRLSQAALETLAVIAYRQPVTRSRVSAIRGVNVDSVVRTLTTRGLVVEVGSDPDTGGGLYRTTDLFLEKMGLQSLEELPSLAPLLPELDSVETDEL